jgi:glycosyltransferase involved in cell wall biosynthesis
MDLLTTSDRDQDARSRVMLDTPPSKAPFVSVVVPVCNEEESLPPLYNRLTEVFAAAPAPYRDSYEIIFVDDGSTDGSFSVCAALQQQDVRVSVVQFRRNFGKTAALHAGFARCRGQRVVTIDADMQEDPGDMFRLLDTIDTGYDLVSAWRQQRHDPLSKTLPSRLFNGVVARLTGIRLHDFNCGFKAYSREVISDLHLYGELHRFIPVLAQQLGFRVGEAPVPHQRRRFGKSKFGGTKRLGHGYLDFIQVLFLTSYLHRPLRLFGAVGTLFLAIGLLISLYMSWLWLNHIPIGTRPLLTLGVLLVITGLQFISTGLVGEMLRNSTFRSGDDYAIRQVLGGDAKAEG